MIRTYSLIDVFVFVVIVAILTSVVVGIVVRPKR
jgi:hypothetical protein